MAVPHVRSLYTCSENRDVVSDRRLAGVGIDEYRGPFVSLSSRLIGQWERVPLCLCSLKVGPDTEAQQETFKFKCMRFLEKK